MKQINDNNFGEAIRQTRKPVVIKFYNPKCHLCEGIKPVFESVSSKFGDVYDFMDCNVWESRKLAKFFNVDGVPQLYVIYNNAKTIIPFPENSDLETGYSLIDIVDFLDTFNNIHVRIK
jgi:thioredoxin 1